MIKILSDSINNYLLWPITVTQPITNMAPIYCVSDSENVLKIAPKKCWTIIPCLHQPVTHMRSQPLANNNDSINS